ncbi:hypothetical protein SE17_15900 [Kouleothrix aurantiaca]|uniref:DUF2029 domain-containing protein n=1 Tax=Kouleothrix aurantiaca TaxID=186479 RepID=A0A0P9FGU9_9CHLR|nr:hypothetical protein SE17_15900 [Kouleothrix aurantiaca]
MKETIAKLGAFVTKNIFVSALLGLTLLLALAGFFRILPSLLAIPQSYDFAAYYVAARALTHNLPLYDAHSMDLAAVVGGAKVAYPEYIYPPFFAEVIRPLGGLSFGSARAIWFIINLLSFVGAIELLRRIGRLPLWFTPLATMIGFIFPPVYSTLLLGQINFILLLCITGALFLAVDTNGNIYKEIISGALVGIAAMIKIYPALLLAHFIYVRRWFALVGFLLGIAGAFVTEFLLSASVANSVFYFTRVLPSMSNSSLFPVNVSIFSTVLRLFSRNEFYFAYQSASNYVTVVANPIIDMPFIGYSIVFLGVALIVIASAWKILRNRSEDYRTTTWFHFTLIICVSLLCPPSIHDHYYVLMIIPAVYIVSKLYWSANPALIRKSTAISVVAFLCILLQRYWGPLLVTTHSSLLLVFGFVGGLLIWWLVVQLPIAETITKE